MLGVGQVRSISRREKGCEEAVSLHSQSGRG